MTAIDYLSLDLLHHDPLDNLTASSSSSSARTNASDEMITFDSKELNWPILILSILAVTGTLGNLLVCISISLDKQLQTVTNWFLFSLAIADCLVSLIVLPLSIIKDFQGSWQLPILFCNLYVFFDVLLCTTSIWHLTVLSIDRFLHISRPFRSRERSKRKTFLTIVAIWTFSISISCTILILGFTNHNNILVTVNAHRRYCSLNNPSFIIYGSIICFCIPCTLMLVTYSLTIRRLQLEAAKCYSDPDDGMVIKSQSSERLRRHRSSSKRSSPPSRPTPKENTLSLQSSLSPSEPDVPWPIAPTTTTTNTSSNETQEPHHHHHQRSFLHSRLVKKAVHAFKGGTETTSERRAMKVLGIVFFVFLVAWLPFSILNILSAACRSCDVQPSLLNLTSWLGYISSNLNPIIYTAFNVRFRRAFVSILTCQISYFSHKRHGKNFYVFVASNNHHALTTDNEHHHHHHPLHHPIPRSSSRRILSSS